MPVRVLLEFPHGLGDVTQFGVVLKHLRAHRPDWQVDVLVGRGKHTAILGLCHRVFHDQEPRPDGPYDTSLSLGFYENFNRYHDRPCTKITNCLHEVFGLAWDEQLCRYEINRSGQAMHRAASYLRSTGAIARDDGRFNTVLFHYEGNTSPTKKNLAHWQAQAFCDLALKLGRVPIILDWDGRSPLIDQAKIFNPGAGNRELWGGFGSGDAEVIACLIQQSEAYIGIDSGPGKCASATDTPTLICWRGHHPIQFHDPAANTVHLVPTSHASLPPVENSREIVAFFEKHYSFIEYEGEHGLVAQAQKWLAGVLGEKEETVEATGVTFVLPGGIGDCVWALLKIRSIAQDRPINIIVSGDPRKEVDRRALPFLKRFPFVRACQVMDVPIHPDKERLTNTRGRYIYESDGIKGQYHFLIPNAVLEDGRRIEDWLPQYPTDFRIMDQFDWSNTQRGDDLALALGNYCAFYLGPEAGHTNEGHNRGWLWEPRQWIELGKAMQERGLRVAVVGAPYDRSFWENYVRPGVAEAGQDWYDLIGPLEIGETLAFLRKARLIVSYQCGLAIVSHYLGVPVVTWWRGDGDSAHPEKLVSFSERMATAWTNPEYADRYYGAIYTRQTVGDIVAEIDQRGWLK